MSDKKYHSESIAGHHTYQSAIMTLPALKMVQGELPEPDPSGKRQPFRAFSVDKSETEAKDTVTKLIGHLKNNEK